MNDTSRESSHTETVHTLIQQNEDLNARMNVTLRRSAQLEIKIQKLEDAYGMTVRQNDALVHETDILREKMNATERLFVDAHAQKEELQKTFAELYSRSRETEAQLRIELNRLQDQIIRLERFHRRVTKFIKPSLRRNQEREILFEKQISTLRAEANRAHLTSHDLNQAIELERKQKQEVEQSFQQDLARLTSDYENKLGDQKEELIQLRSECERLKENRAQSANMIEQLEDDRVRFQNEAIRETRARIQLETEKQNIFNQNDERFTAHRLHIQSLELELANLREITRAAQTRVKDSEAQIQKCAAEISELRMVRDATMDTLESTAEREARSARLNVELSRALKDVRSEVERLNIEAVAIKAEIAAEITAEKSDVSTGQITERNTIQQIEEKKAFEKSNLNERIEHILSEIQGSQYLPQDWIENHTSSDKFKFARSGNGIITADVEFESLDVEELDDEIRIADDDISDSIIDVTSSDMDI